MRTFAVITFVAVIAAITSLNALASDTVGQPAPALVVQELTGQQFDLSAERGKVVLINFWATWCSPCRKEMPILNDFYQRYHSKGLELIGVSADSPHDRSDVAKVMASLSYPVAMLDDAKTNDFGSPDQLPTTYVIDRTGIVRAIFIADDKSLSSADLDSSVLPLLGKGTAAKSGG
jgi:cytochrome c biogenesis protein CcmG, thiol:disulfide interchange protein DsbE